MQDKQDEPSTPDAPEYRSAAEVIGLVLGGVGAVGGVVGGAAQVWSAVTPDPPPPATEVNITINVTAPPPTQED